MRYISAEDVELIKTLNFIFNSKANSDKILESLRKNYEKDSMNAQNAFSYGYYNFLLASKSEDATVGSEMIELTFRAYDDALKIIPDYWLVYMFKAVVILSLPELMRNDEELVRVLDKMIRLQECAEKHPPYFWVTYVLSMDYYYSIGEPEKVKSLLNQKEGVARSPIHMKYVDSYFAVPFKSFLRRLNKSGEKEMAQKILEVAQDLFPQNEDFNGEI